MFYDFFSLNFHSFEHSYTLHIGFQKNEPVLSHFVRHKSDKYRDVTVC